MMAMKIAKRGSLLAALTIMGVTASSGPAAASSEARSCQPEDIIVASGRGEVQVSPDSMSIALGVVVQARTVDPAWQEVNAKLQGAIRAIRALGISGLKLETQTIEVNQRLDKDGRPIGFEVRNVLSIMLREVPTERLAPATSRIIDAGVAAGANRVDEIRFFLADTRDAETRALAMAVKDAQSTARTIADAAGVSLSGLCSVTPVEGFRGSLFRVAAYREEAPVEIGELVIRSEVTSHYSFSK